MNTNQRVIYKQPYAQAMQEQLLEWGSRRVLLATNTSLSGPSGLANQVREAIGKQWTGTVEGLGAHAPRADVIRLVKAIEHHQADSLVGLGGGSVTSVVKAARLALANEVRDVDGIDRLIGKVELSSAILPCIMLPTTLSAGEFTTSVGVTNQLTRRKQAIHHPSLAPNTVVLDPALTLNTPPALWFSTAIRALDHIVETWCSSEATPLSDATSLHGLRLLLHGLKNNERLSCQEGAWLAIQGIATGVPQGASHGIGHALGGIAGVGHGDTSCIMLAHVLRFNFPVNALRQQQLANEWEEGGGELDKHIDKLVRSLRLPQTLRETGISKDVLSQVAREAMNNPWVILNPRKFSSEKEMLELLQAAW